MKNESAQLAAAIDPVVESLQRRFAAQRAAFAAAPYPSLERRRDQLRALKHQIRRYQDVFVEAMSRDFGHRAAADSKMLDLMGSVLEIAHALKHLKRWMQPSRRATELLFVSNALHVHYQPKGVVGIITPWNFPVYLALGPLTAALAAGNRALIKMSEATPATNAVLRRMLGEIFAEDEVCVIGEELLDPTAFTALPFDHIVFTGSPAVGKHVMRAAAAHLTPVTLELGGKSPALVLPDYDIGDAARRIVHGKGTNCGQVCVAPDYALVPRARLDEFVAEAHRHFRAMYGTQPVASHDYTAIVNERQYARLQGLLDDARAQGAKVLVCAEADASHAGERRLPLHLITGVTPQMSVMQEELFGPLLPILPYDSVDQALRHITAGERPLALYVFGHDAGERERILRRTHAGGVTVNDWAWHVMNHDAPFGGTGHSGMGNYHGAEGFRELSHARTVFVRRRWFPTQWFHPPFGTFVQRLTLKLFLRQGDPGLKIDPTQ